jgi:hypothetical protein
MWNSAAGCFIRLGSAPVGVLTVDAIQGAAIANRTVGQLYKQILLASGISAADIVDADITALDTTAPYETGVYVSHNRDVTPLQLLDELCNSVGAWFGVDAFGKFRIGRIEVPTGTAVGTITATEIIQIERVASRDPGVGVPAWKAKVGYRKLQRTLPDLSSTVADFRKAFFTEEYRRVEANDTAVQAVNLTSPELEFLTVLSAEADANTEAARLLAIYKVRRDMYEVTVRVDSGLANVIDLGKIVTLQINRFGMTAGKKFLIIGVRTNMRAYHFELTLWG